MDRLALENGVFLRVGNEACRFAVVEVEMSSGS